MLKVALQMDPPQSINIRMDSSYILGIEAQKRGAELFYYHPSDLSWHSKQGSFAKMQRLEFTDNPANPAILGAAEQIILNQLDVILMRQDPPFDMNYITRTHLLEQAGNHVKIFNHPRAVRDMPEKLWVNLFKQYMPETLISNDVHEVKKFQQAMGKIIIKPLYGNGGFGIFMIDKAAENLDALLELFQSIDNLPIIAQQYLPNISKGDKRIILIDGEIGGAINRVPQANQVRSNLHVGGTACKTTLTKTEHEICEMLKPELKKHDLLFTGIDVIDGHLTEINITSPTGIQEINHFDNVRLEQQIWDAIERKL